MAVTAGCLTDTDDLAAGQRCTTISAAVCSARSAQVEWRQIDSSSISFCWERVWYVQYSVRVVVAKQSCVFQVQYSVYQKQKGGKKMCFVSFA